MFEDKIDRLREQIEALRSDLPYDELDEDDVPIEDFSGDLLEDGELEDEVVEAEAVISELEQQMLESDDMKGDDSDIGGLPLGKTVSNCPRSEAEFYQMMQSWLIDEMRTKNSKDGVSESDDTMSRRAAAIIVGAKAKGDFPKAEELGKTFFSEYAFKADELQQADLYSIGLFHITFEVIRIYRLIPYDFDLHGWINFKKEMWGNMI